MKLLLDTHTLLWQLNDNKALSAYPTSSLQEAVLVSRPIYTSYSSSNTVVISASCMRSCQVIVPTGRVTSTATSWPSKGLMSLKVAPGKAACNRLSNVFSAS